MIHKRLAPCWNHCRPKTERILRQMHVILCYTMMYIPWVNWDKLSISWYTSFILISRMFYSFFVLPHIPSDSGVFHHISELSMSSAQGRPGVPGTSLKNLAGLDQGGCQGAAPWPTSASNMQNPYWLMIIGGVTLWLCQNSYWRSIFLVDIPWFTY